MKQLKAPVILTMLVVLLAALALSGCTSPTPTAAPTAAPTATPAPTVTPAPTPGGGSRHADTRAHRGTDNGSSHTDTLPLGTVDQQCPPERGQTDNWR